MDIPKIARWVNVLFPLSMWKDKNKNFRFDWDEMGNFSDGAKKMIDQMYKKTYDEIDKNKDGISYDEIQRYVVLKNINIPADLRSICESLVKKGSASAANGRIIIVSEDKIPKELSQDRNFMEVVKNETSSNIATTISLVKKNGKYSGMVPADAKGESKYALIILKGQLLKKPQKEIAESIEHELIHVRQIFSGKNVENDFLNILIIKTLVYFLGEDANKYVKTFEKIKFGVIFSELEAYKKDLYKAIANNDKAKIERACFYINGLFAQINKGKEELAKVKGDDFIGLIDTVTAENITKEEMVKLNNKMGKIAKNPSEKNKLYLHQNMNFNQWVHLYKNHFLDYKPGMFFY